MRTLNVGEGLAFIGIFLAIAILRNYWLLLFLLIPCWSWQKIDSEKDNKYSHKRRKLELEKLKEEIRLLKIRKK